MNTLANNINQVYAAGVGHLKNGHLDQAEAAFRSVLSMRKNTPEAWFQLGELERKRGNLFVSGENFRKALKMKPNEPVIWKSYINLILQLDDAREAEKASALLRKAKLDPRFKKMANGGIKTAKAAPRGSGKLSELTAQAKFDEVVAVGRGLIDSGSDHPRLVAKVADAFVELGRTSDAVDVLTEALQKTPNEPETRERRAGLYQRIGSFEAAREDLRNVVANHPERGSAFLLYAEGGRFQPDDPMIGQMEAAYADPATTPHARMCIGFALGKAMENIGRYDQVFKYLNDANALGRANNPYDIKARQSEVRALKSAFGPTDFSKPVAGAIDSFAPIFVTGLPRSGTTLVEQILSCAPDVAAAGEDGRFLEQCYATLLTAKGAVRPINSVPAPDMVGIAERYLDGLRKVVDFKRFVTDKSIQTHLVLGVAAIVLPDARFVVVRRDPRDNLLSMYKNMFRNNTHPYANDLRDLGLYYRTFVDMVAFWKEKLPGRVTEIWYDDLVSNPEEETRKLVAAAGLEWDDAFLSPHENAREVKTLSVQQVRQPINKGSKEAWRRYEADLAPMIEALGDLVER